MKRFFTTVLSVLAVVGAFAVTTAPTYLSENFWAQAQAGDYPTDGWKTYGNGATPQGDSQGYFHADGSGPYYVLIQNGLSAIAFTWTSFVDAAGQPVAADQWLVSPEFEVTDDDMVLTFTACTYTNVGNFGSGDSPYKVLLSETGDTPADFTEAPVFEGYETASAETNTIGTKMRYVPLHGYKGKKLRLAFVATGEATGMLGFTDIQIGSYFVNLTNNTVSISRGNEMVYPSVNVEMKVAVPCSSFTARLQSEGIDETLVMTDRRLYEGSQIAYKLVEFESAIDLFDNSVPYTISITPDYEGAPSTVIATSIAVPQASYPNNVVIEELTGTTCQYCPRGAAALEYYQENYPGTETQGKAIGIAIHDSSVGTDPMANLTVEYNTLIMALNNYKGLPQAIFNRKSNSEGQDPTSKTVFDRYMASKSIAKGEITGVEIYRPDEWSGNFKVDYQVRTGFDIEGFDLRASCVLIENDVVGFNKDYNQLNAYSRWTDDQVSSNFGEWLVPYMQFYTAKSSSISYRDMVYQHVARGIYPDFDGELVSSIWECDVPQSFSMEFTMPDYVDDIFNTEVILIVTNPLTQEIVASDIFPAKNYIDTTSVTLTAEESGEAVYYNLQGMRVANPEPGNLYIVRQGKKASKVLYTK